MTIEQHVPLPPVSPPIVEGPSRFGWSYYGTFRKCPRLFAYKFRLGLSDYKEAAVRGILVHALLEGHYKAALEGRYYEDTDARECAETYGAKLGLPSEERDRCLWIFRQYRLRYAGERLDLVASEQELGMSWAPVQGGAPVPYTARVDLVYRESGGIIILDFKTTATLTRSTARQYVMHGQMHGLVQLGMYHYGREFRGVRLGLIQSDDAKSPRFAREPVDPAPSAVQEFPQLVIDTAHEIMRWEASGRPWHLWPKTSHEQVCSGKYGDCPFLRRCRGVEVG